MFIGKFSSIYQPIYLLSEKFLSFLHTVAVMLEPGGGLPDFGRSVVLFGSSSSSKFVQIARHGSRFHMEVMGCGLARLSLSDVDIIVSSVSFYFLL